MSIKLIRCKVSFCQTKPCTCSQRLIQKQVWRRLTFNHFCFYLMNHSGKGRERRNVIFWYPAIWGECARQRARGMDLFTFGRPTGHLHELPWRNGYKAHRYPPPPQQIEQSPAVRFVKLALWLSFWMQMWRVSLLAHVVCRICGLQNIVRLTFAHLYKPANFGWMAS